MLVHALVGHLEIVVVIHHVEGDLLPGRDIHRLHLAALGASPGLKPSATRREVSFSISQSTIASGLARAASTSSDCRTSSAAAPSPARATFQNSTLGIATSFRGRGHGKVTQRSWRRSIGGAAAHAFAIR